MDQNPSIYNRIHGCSFKIHQQKKRTNEPTFAIKQLKMQISKETILLKFIMKTKPAELYQKYKTKHKRLVAYILIQLTTEELNCKHNSYNKI